LAIIDIVASTENAAKSPSSSLSYPVENKGRFSHFEAKPFPIIDIVASVGV